MPRPGRLLRFLGDYRYPLGVFVASRLLTFLAVGMAGWVARPKADAWTLTDVFLRPLSSWDGIWYLRIADHGYDPAIAHGNTPAFFPLYPYALRGLHAVLPFAEPALLGVALSTACFGLALMGLWRLTLDRFGEAVARRTVVYVSVFPLAFTFSAVYTESLFLLLLVTTFLLVERSRFALACVVAALAAITRPVGVLLLIPIVWRLVAARDEIRGRRRVIALAALTLPVLALAVFQAYLWYRTGAFGATELAQERGWGRSSRPLLLLLMPVAFINAAWTVVAGNHDLSYAFCASFASIWFWTIVIAIRRRLPLEYVAFAAAALALPILAGSYLAVPRYGMVLFPLLWVWAQLGADEHVDSALRSLMPALLTGLVFVTFNAGTFTP